MLVCASVLMEQHVSRQKFFPNFYIGYFVEKMKVWYQALYMTMYIYMIDLYNGEGLCCP